MFLSARRAILMAVQRSTKETEMIDKADAILIIESLKTSPKISPLTISELRELLISLDTLENDDFSPVFVMAQRIVSQLEKGIPLS